MMPPDNKVAVCLLSETGHLISASFFAVWPTLNIEQAFFDLLTEAILSGIFFLKEKLFWDLGFPNSNFQKIKNTQSWQHCKSDFFQVTSCGKLSSLVSETWQLSYQDFWKLLPHVTVFKTLKESKGNELTFAKKVTFFIFVIFSKRNLLIDFWRKLTSQDGWYSDLELKGQLWKSTKNVVINRNTVIFKVFSQCMHSCGVHYGNDIEEF